MITGPFKAAMVAVAKRQGLSDDEEAEELLQPQRCCDA